jgi:multidrug efflux pump subunit AcrA (membrane-fusion protein)
VRFDALDGHVLEGIVTEVAAAADPMTGTWRVEVSVPGAAGLGGGLMGGMGLIGELEIRPVARGVVALIPIDALLEADGARAVVFTLAPDGRRAQRREITIGFLAGDRVAVTGGLDGARTVVTDGAAFLDDGSLVRVQP